MTIETLLQQKEKDGILKYRPLKGEYILSRPIDIVFSSDTITHLNSIYVATREKGGILEGVYKGTRQIEIVKFIEVQNEANNTYNYNPNMSDWNNTILKILERGNLPFGIHTHPTKLGLSSYDNRKPIFHIKSSRPDRQVARAGFDDILILPEVIFVKDSRYEQGFKISMFEGYIFPYSITGITNNQIIAVSLAITVIVFKDNPKQEKNIFIFLLIWFLWDFARRPNYIYSPNGLTIKVG